MAQGSVLGPLLFNIYVCKYSNMSSQGNSAVLQLADDLKIFCVIHDNVDFHQLQDTYVV